MGGGVIFSGTMFALRITLVDVCLARVRDRCSREGRIRDGGMLGKLRTQVHGNGMIAVKGCE